MSAPPVEFLPDYDTLWDENTELRKYVKELANRLERERPYRSEPTFREGERNSDVIARIMELTK